MNEHCMSSSTIKKIYLWVLPLLFVFFALYQIVLADHVTSLNINSASRATGDAAINRNWIRLNAGITRTALTSAQLAAGAEDGNTFKVQYTVVSTGSEDAPPADATWAYALDHWSGGSTGTAPISGGTFWFPYETVQTPGFYRIWIRGEHERKLTTEGDFEKHHSDPKWEKGGDPQTIVGAIDEFEYEVPPELNDLKIINSTTHEEYTGVIGSDESNDYSISLRTNVPLHDDASVQITYVTVKGCVDIGIFGVGAPTEYEVGGTTFIKLPITTTSTTPTNEYNCKIKVEYFHHSGRGETVDSEQKTISINTSGIPKVTAVIYKPENSTENVGDITSIDNLTSFKGTVSLNDIENSPLYFRWESTEPNSVLSVTPNNCSDLLLEENEDGETISNQGVWYEVVPQGSKGHDGIYEGCTLRATVGDDRSEAFEFKNFTIDTRVENAEITYTTSLNSDDPETNNDTYPNPDGDPFNVAKIGETITATLTILEVIFTEGDSAPKLKNIVGSDDANDIANDPEDIEFTRGSCTDTDTQTECIFSYEVKENDFNKDLLITGTPIHFTAYNLTDIAGNVSSQRIPIPALIIDGIKPNVTGTEVTTSDGTNDDNSNSRAKAGEAIEIEFQVNEILHQDPSVTVAGNSATGSCTENADGMECSYTYTVEEGDNHANVVIEVEMEDLARNVNSEQIPSPNLVIDTTQPKVVSINLSALTDSAAKDNVTNNEDIALVIVTDGELKEGSDDGFFGQISFGSGTDKRTTTINRINKANNQYHAIFEDNQLPEGTFSNSSNSFYIEDTVTTDLAGNALTIPDDTSYSITIDRTPPEPTIDLQGASDHCARFIDPTNGVLRPPSTCSIEGKRVGTDEDNITNDTTPTFDVSNLETADTFYLTTIDESGTFSDDDLSAKLNGGGTESVTATVGNGEYIFAIKATDLAGNISSEANEKGMVTVIIDNSTPSSVHPDDYSIEHDSGSRNNDNLTNDKTPQFVILQNKSQGSFQQPEYISIFLEKSGQTVYSNQLEGPLLCTVGTPTTCGYSVHIVKPGREDSEHKIVTPPFDPEDPENSEYLENLENLDDGDYILSSRILDEAGNVGPSSTKRIFIDTVANAPTVSLNSVSDSGWSNNDRITNEAEVSITVSGIEGNKIIEENGEDVHPQDNSTVFVINKKTGELVHGRVTPLHQETFDITLQEGLNTLVITQRDNAENLSEGTEIEIVLDTTPPAAPEIPDLQGEDDTFGENANESRTGTDEDNLTYQTDNLTFSSTASGTGTPDPNANGNHDQHHIKFYKWTPSAGDSGESFSNIYDYSGWGQPGYKPTLKDISVLQSVDVQEDELTELKVVGDNDETNISNGVSTKDLYTEDTDQLTEQKVHFFVAKQVDVAGNTSGVSDILPVEIDTTALSPSLGNLTLHPESDGGSSNTDFQTSDVRPVFTTARIVTIPEKSAFGRDLDYFELRRRRNGEETAIYPSSKTSVEQGSYNRVGEDILGGFAVSPLGTEDGELFAEENKDIYDNGVAIRILSQDIPQYNTDYLYQARNVDLAGNSDLKTYSDIRSITILVPPPTPSAPDLEDADDSSWERVTNGDTDNYTNKTVWTIEGSFQNKTQDEIDNDAANGVGEVEVEIFYSATNDFETVGAFTQLPSKIFDDVLGADDTDDNNIDEDGNDNNIAKPASANDPYTYSFEFSTKDGDGYYKFTAQAANTGGERGIVGPELVVTQDTTSPTRDSVLLSIVRQIESGIIEHEFFISVGTDNEENDVHYILRSYLENGELIIGLALIGIDGSYMNKALENQEVDYIYGESGVASIFIDKAGNILEFGNAANTRGLVPIEAIPPVVTSYRLGGDNYVIVATPYVRGDEEGAAILTVEQYSGVCTIEGETASTVTDYTLTEIIESGTGKCVKVTDTRGNSYYIAVADEANDLVTNFELNDADDTGEDTEDRITNNNSPRVSASTIPGSSLILQVIVDEEDFPEPDATTGEYTYTDSFKGINLNEDRNTGVFKGRLPELSDNEYKVRGLVVIPESDTVQVVELTDQNIVIDTIASVSPQHIVLNETINHYITNLRNGLVISEAEDLEADPLQSSDSAEISKMEFALLQGGGIVEFPSFDETPVEAVVTVSRNSDENFIERILFSDEGDLLEQGIYIVRAISIDIAGNRSEAVTQSITVDKTNPSLTVLGLNYDIETDTITAQTEFIAVASDTQTDTTIVVADGVNSCSTDTSTTTLLGEDGKYNPVSERDGDDDTLLVCFIATDEAGNKTAQNSKDHAIQGIANLQLSNSIGSHIGQTIYTKPTRQTTWTGISAEGATAKLYVVEEGSEAPTASASPNGGILNPIPTGGAVSITSTFNFVAGKTYEIYGSIIPLEGSETPLVKLLSVIVDNTRPTYSTNPTITSSDTVNTLANSEDTLTATFQVGEDLKSVTNATIAGIAATCPTGSVSANTDVACSATLTNQATEGPATLRVTLTDLAGNSATRNTNSNQIVDATAPTATVTVNPEVVKGGSNVSATIQLVDTNGVINLPVTATLSTGATLSLNQTTTTTITAPATDGPVTIDLPALSDGAGNTFDNPPQTIFYVDAVAPVIDEVSSSSRNRDLTVSVTLDHANTFAPTSRIFPESIYLTFTGACSAFKNTRSESVANGTSLDQKYTFTMRISRAGRYTGCSVVAIDQVGNESAPANITGEIRISSPSSGGGSGTGRAPVVEFPGALLPENQTPDEAPALIPPVVEQPQTTQRRVIGEVGEDIRELQEFLNGTNCPVAPEGQPGGPGSETTYYGPATQRALECYEAQGERVPSTESETVSTQRRVIGEVGEDIRELQEFLNGTNCPVAPEGQPGGPGSETTYYGPATQRALECYEAQGERVPSTESETVSTQRRVIGEVGEDIRELQEFLNGTNCPVAPEGQPGGPGSETTYYGPATQRALECYEAQGGSGVQQQTFVEAVAPLPNYQIQEGGSGAGAPQTQAPPIQTFTPPSQEIEEEEPQEQQPRTYIPAIAPLPNYQLQDSSAQGAPRF